MAFSDGSIPEEIFADPEDTVDYLTKVGDFLSNYAWYLFGAFLIIGFSWPKIQRYLDKIYEKYESRRYAAKYHKNPDLALERLEGLQRARQRMQEELDRKAREYEEKKKQKELEAAQARIAEAEDKARSGYRLGDSSSSSNNSNRPEYNPLMGDSSRGYRAPKRSGCPGGGCGR